MSNEEIYETLLIAKKNNKFKEELENIPLEDIERVYYGLVELNAERYGVYDFNEFYTELKNIEDTFKMINSKPKKDFNEFVITNYKLVHNNFAIAPNYEGMRAYKLNDTSLYRLSLGGLANQMVLANKLNITNNRVVHTSQEKIELYKVQGVIGLRNNTSNKYYGKRDIIIDGDNIEITDYLTPSDLYLCIIYDIFSNMTDFYFKQFVETNNGKILKLDAIDTELDDAYVEVYTRDGVRVSISVARLTKITLKYLYKRIQDILNLIYDAITVRNYLRNYTIILPRLEDLKPKFASKYNYMDIVYYVEPV